MRTTVLALALAACAAIPQTSATAAAGTLLVLSQPDPVAGAGCKRYTAFHYDTTKNPPVWSSGWVVCT